MAGYYTGLACGATLAFAESVETVRENMLEVRPTIVTTVPRLFERIQSRIIKQVDAGSPLRQRLFHWAMGVGREYAAGTRVEPQHTPASSSRFPRRRQLADAILK